MTAFIRQEHSRQPGSMFNKGKAEYSVFSCSEIISPIVSEMPSV